MIRKIGIYIMMLAFVIIIVGIVYFNFSQPVEPSAILYKQYCDQLIKVEDSGIYEVQANVVNNSYLAVLLTSTTDTSTVAHVTASFSNNAGKEIFGESVGVLVLSNNHGLATVRLPDLGNHYAGAINISIIYEEVDREFADASNISYETSDTLPLSLTITNHNSYNVSNLNTQVVAFRNNKIIDIETFYDEQVLSQATVTKESSVFLANDDNSVPYDNLLVFALSADIG